MADRTRKTSDEDRTNRASAERDVKAKIPVIEEELQVGKRAVERGGARVTTKVKEKPVEANVKLREEHVHIERTPVDRPVTNADKTALNQGTVEVRERAEVAVVGKRARVVEEVAIGKEVAERTETVRDTVHRTDVKVEEVEPGTRQKRRAK